MRNDTPLWAPLVVILGTLAYLGVWAYVAWHWGADAGAFVVVAILMGRAVERADRRWVREPKRHRANVGGVQVEVVEQPRPRGRFVRPF